MTTYNSMLPVGTGKIAKCLSLIFILFLLAGCGGNTKVNLVESVVNRNHDRQAVVYGPELRRILINHFGNVRIKLTDAHYTLPDDGMVARLNDSVRRPPHGDNATKSIDWDCNDYTIAAMVPMRNYAFGAIYAKTEAGKVQVLNVFINRNKEVKYWAPQSCKCDLGLPNKLELILF